MATLSPFDKNYIEFKIFLKNSTKDYNFDLYIQYSKQDLKNDVFSLCKKFFFKMVILFPNFWIQIKLFYILSLISRKLVQVKL